jgi:hypothetical protein
MPPERYTAASAFVTILPYMEQHRLYEQLGVERGGLWNHNVDDLASWYHDPGKADAIVQRLPLFVCPSDLSQSVSDAYPVPAATGSYALVQGTEGGFILDAAGVVKASYVDRIVAKYDNDGLFMYVVRRRGSELTDGKSRTLMIGEVIMADTWESSNTWTYARLNCDSLRTTEFALNTPPGEGSLYEMQNGVFASQHPGLGLFAFADGHVDAVHDDIELSVYQAMSTLAGED